jgi:cyanate permease
MRDTRAKEAAALARLNQNYGFLLHGSGQGDSYDT